MTAGSTLIFIFMLTPFHAIWARPVHELQQGPGLSRTFQLTRQHSLWTGFWGEHLNLPKASKMCYSTLLIPNYWFFMARQPLLGQGLFTLEASRSHSDTPHSLRLLSTNDPPDAEISTWQHTALKRDRHPCPLWYSNPKSQQASGHRTMT
jgi:hypothetical protein